MLRWHGKISPTHWSWPKSLGPKTSTVRARARRQRADANLSVLSSLGRLADQDLRTGPELAFCKAFFGQKPLVLPLNFNGEEHVKANDSPRIALRNSLL